MERTAGPVLVTGATGFVGRHMVDLLLGHGYEVAAASVPGDPLLPALPPGVSRLAFDILDLEATTEALARLAPSVVFHLAGLARGGDLQRLLAVNVMGTECLLKAARALDQPATVVIPGSASEYGIFAAPEPVNEDAPLAPISAYGVSKAAQTLLGLSYARRGDVPVVVGRIFNITGPREPQAMLVGAMAGQVAAIERGRLPAVVSVGNLDPYRDYIDVRDAVQGLWLLSRYGESGRAYNLCSGTAIQVREVVRRVVALSNVPIRIEPDPDRQRPSDIPYCAGDPQRAESATGWQPQYSLDESLQAALAWWREASQA